MEPRGTSEGIFSVDRTRHTKNRLNPLKLEQYSTWKMSGEPLNWDRVVNGSSIPDIKFLNHTIRDTTNTISKPNCFNPCCTCIIFSRNIN